MQLRSIDVLIGLSVVMLVGSFVVTMLTHMVTSLANTRGRHLFRGVADLIRHLDPTMEQKIAEEISGSVLKNPMVSEISSRFATVVSREELTTLLLDFASGAGVQKLGDSALAALRSALQKNQVSNPEQTLSNIRDLALRLEQSNPELANDVRGSMAILHEAPSAFVAKINGWFDQTIQRVSARFTASTHAITFVLALLTAVVLQMDTLAIANRLYADPVLRQKLVEAAPKVSADLAPGSSSSATPGAAAPKPSAPVAPSTDQGTTLNDRVLADVDAMLGKSGVFSVPAWTWERVGGFLPLPVWSAFNMQKLLGVLLSAGLLSLGAPFWYETLKTTLKLRSSLAETDEAQRLIRQTTQTPSGDGSTGAPAPSVSKLTEAGNLNLNANAVG